MLSGNTHTIAVRLLLPFLRVYGADPRALAAVRAEGVDIGQLTRSDARLSHALAMRLLVRLVRDLDDPELGLRAGAAVQLGDLDAASDLAGSQSTLGSAGSVIMRYFRLLRTGADFRIEVQGAVARYRYQLLDELDEPPAAHDFVVSSITTFVQLLTGRYPPKIEVHFAHNDRTYVSAYQRAFQCPVRFHMGCTAVVFPAEQLTWPIMYPMTALSDHFESQAREKLRAIDSQEGIAALVHRTLRASLNSADVSMPALARRLGLSVPTLRRKLAAESTSHTQILDQVRKELAMSLLEREESVSKVSESVGFADTTTFHRAFRRWTGMTLREYRRGSG